MRWLQVVFPPSEEIFSLFEETRPASLRRLHYDVLFLRVIGDTVLAKTYSNWSLIAQSVTRRMSTEVCKISSMNEFLPDILPMTLQPELDSIVREYVSKAHTQLPTFPLSGYMPNDMGSFLSQSICFLDFLADGLVGGPHMKADATAAVQQLEKDNDLSELDALDNLVDTRIILRKICRCIHETATEVRSLWKELPPPPAVENLSDVQLTSQTQPACEPANVLVPPFVQVGHAAIPDALHTTSNGSLEVLQGWNMAQPQTPPATGLVDPVSQPDDLINDMDEWCETLRTRGTGSYTCPFGLKCNKGAVEKDGSLVVFTRNSEIRTHVEKHLKRWKCNLPNCPTRKGFSRQDQLKRHQENVAHEPSI
ncbi:hypothetical protein GGR57DRAFT_182325 [Xylariaceae sp. FL1272]|nr:hypothetical protein GGR57DRAFT_182325 [Xylariaceae sp. FL1272]